MVGDCGTQVVGGTAEAAEAPTAGTTIAATRQLIPSSTQTIRARQREPVSSVLQWSRSALLPPLSERHRRQLWPLRQVTRTRLCLGEVGTPFAQVSVRSTLVPLDAQRRVITGKLALNHGSVVGPALGIVCQHHDAVAGRLTTDDEVARVIVLPPLPSIVGGPSSMPQPAPQASSSSIRQSGRQRASSSRSTWAKKRP